ncbi:tetratricopeptide repeat protein 37 [Schistocerca americana]|uniref:tetratricopeptide repeat protein 37 n=1 Tax=Schistocerca americana TaxID=7009 RepID=UPI001F4F2C00|nr:tetratricopeptide repeat protein 37 [Schistocerca americana]XP_049960503.1 tetratricopeptide repeat protein 37 [Schistocerca serialis cubense]
MDAKEIKTNLKEAREAIKNKDFNTALQKCKAVLKADRNNYVGLVLFGVALQESDKRDQAPNAFRKAIEASPKQLLAWQGLASFYEKDDSETAYKELYPVYQQLLILETDIGKYREICNKLAELTLKSKKCDTFAEILDYQIEIVSDEKKSIALRTLVTVLGQIPDLNAKLSAKLEDALSLILQDDLEEEKEDYYKKYLKLLYKCKKYKELMNEAINMHLLYKKMEYPLEWICKCYSEATVHCLQSVNHVNSCIEDYITRLLALNQNSGLALLAKGAKLFNDGSFTDACEVLKQVVPMMPNSCYVYVLLCQCYLATYCFVDSEFCAREALSKLVNLNQPQEDMKHLLNFALVKSLCMQGREKCEEAVSKCEEILSSYGLSADILICMARAYISLDEFEQARKCFDIIGNENKSSALLLEALMLKKDGKFEEALAALNAAAATDPSQSEIWLEKGKLLWEKGEHDESLIAFLKATKLDPNSYYCFVYLGRYYSLNDKDLDKARRCYQKAFQLNPRGDEAGIGLSDTYRRQKYVDLNLQLLNYITEKAGPGGAKWAWLRLGLHHQDQGNIDEAINCLQSAVRADLCDSHCWESLADAYYARGSYNAALKCYEHVQELSPDALYPAYQIASVKQLVGSFVESVSDYRAVVAANPKYVPALKGLGETCLLLARSYASQKLIGRCKDSCQEAVDALSRAVEERRNLACLWKLLGDVFNLIQGFPEELATLRVQSWLAQTEPTVNLEEGVKYLSKEEVLQLGARCYCRALTLSPHSDLIWHDLAVNYQYQAENTAMRNLKNQLRNWALKAAKKCVTLSPRNCQHWNLLGVVAASPEINNLKLAQHSFIKAIELEKNNAVPWTNLGTLYLCLGEIKLANRAFGKAQRADPEYVECWIGQALIAETVDVQEAMDLFRHTTVLGVHPESCLGYAHWVCSTLLNTKTHQKDAHYIYSVEKMHAVPVAGDSMMWYTGVIPKDACALNMLGLLMERQQLYGTAAAAFCKALQLLESEEGDEKRDIVFANYGRVLVQLQQYDAAIKSYLQVKKATFKTQCGLAVAYFKAEKYEESYETYDSVLHWLASDDGLKSHVLVAMATMAYKFQGVEDSKTLLLQSAQLKPPSVEGYFALCALGMLNEDLNLTEVVLKELVSYDDDPNYVMHIAVFRAYMHFIQRRTVESKRSLSGAVHRHPGEASLWLSLALMLLHLYPRCNPAGAAQCAQVALSLGRGSMDVSKVMSLVSLSHLLSGKAKASLSSSQKAVHMFPDIPENWVVLIASFLPWCILSSSCQSLHWMKQLIGHVRRKMEASRQMNKWLSSHERKVTLLAEEFTVKA